MKINIFRGELNDISARKEALVPDSNISSQREMHIHSFAVKAKLKQASICVEHWIRSMKHVACDWPERGCANGAASSVSVT